MKILNETRKSFGGTIRFKELMDELNGYLGKLTDLVIEMIEEGHKALIEDDEGLFKKIEENLHKVHELSYQVEDSVQSSLALHQPFASDLRYILSTLKITNEIHRSAHDAVHIANSTTFVDIALNKELIKRVVELAKRASLMFEKSIDAFRHRKELDITEWKKLDDRVDSLHAKLIDDIIAKIQKEPSWARAGMSLVLATRYIERIADHACNIVEESIFVVTSKRVKIE